MVSDIHMNLARAVGVPVGRCSGGRLATTLVATINDVIFSFSFFLLSVFFFSHRRSARLKKTYFAKVDGSAQKPGGRLLSRLRQPFWGPWQPFWIFEAIIEGMVETKNLLSES